MDLTRRCRKTWAVGLIVAFIGPLLFIAAARDCAAAPAGSGTPAGSATVVTSVSDPAPVGYFWGCLWYFRGESVYDEGTMVVGGAEGSAMMVFQAKNTPTEKETWWIFLDGKFMYLVSPGPPVQVGVTSTKGDTLVTVPGQPPVPPIKPQPALINDLLVQVYGYSKITAAQPIRHMPFLDGLGWPHGTGTGKGAWYETAKGVLKQMDLETKVINSNGLKPTGYVVYQHLPGGKLLGPADANVVRLALDGSTDAPVPKVLPTCVAGGDSFFDAGGIAELDTACGDTFDKHDTVTARCAEECGPGVPSPDVVWKLLPADGDRTVKVEAPFDPEDPRLNKNLRISVWVCQQGGKTAGIPCAVSMSQPTECRVGDNLEFQTPVPANATTYLVAEDVLGARVRVRLEIKRPQESK
jgi:hypothetical protein